MNNTDIQNKMLQIVVKIKETRIALGFTQDEVAKNLNIERSSYTRLESGKTSVSLPILFSIGEMFKKPVSYFLGEEIKSAPRLQEMEPKDAILSLDLRLMRQEKNFDWLMEAMGHISSKILQKEKEIINEITVMKEHIESVKNLIT